ncbi:MAG: PAS domain S-box-containing protein [Clostridium sp.]|jgi:PAS domain S-box-containing protein
MEDAIANNIIEPCLYSCDSIITKVNKEFIDFTGFTVNELLGKSLIEIGAMIKINSQMLIDNISSEYFGYIFTKHLEAREVTISILFTKGTIEKAYSFIEKPNSRLSDKLIFVEQTFIENISCAAIYSVPELILLKSNQRYLDFMDLPFNKKENSIGKPIFKIVTGFVGSKDEAIFNTLIKSGKTNDVKGFKHDSDARGITYWDLNQTPIFENGKIKYIYQTSYEVTERVIKNLKLERQNKIIDWQKEKLKQKNIELEQHLKKQLEEKNTQLITIIENLSEGVIVADSKGKFIMTNPEANRLIYQSDQVSALGEAFKTIKYFDMEGNNILLENMPGIRALKGEKVKNVKMFVSHPSKEYFMEASSTPIYNTDGDLTIVVSCFHDITEAIKQSRKIEEQKKELEAFIENMPDAIVIYNKHGDFNYFNAEARKLYPKINYHNKRDDVHNEFQYYDLYDNIILKENLPTMRAFRGEKIRNERIVIKRTDKLQITEINGTPIFDHENNLVSVIMSHRDISEDINNQMHIKNQQGQLLIAEKEKREALKEVIKLKDEFLYLITHELKTPLAVTNLALQAIDHLCKDEVTQRVGKYLKTINQNTYRQLRLINNLLDITRISSSQVKMNKTNFDIVYVIEAIVSSVQLYAEQKNVNLKFTTNLSIKNIYFDEEKVERILLNLLSNALKFTSSGKSITVSLSMKNHKKADMISISVQDEGAGIAEDKQKMIFERFGQADSSFSRQAEGTGLGLYLVRLLVSELDGEISLKSHEGVGSTFTVLLPVIDPINIDEITSCNEVNSKLVSGDNNVIQTAKIEFSDIYF